jgi:hypothetical protein
VKDENLMRAVCDAKGVLRTSVAVVAMVWFGQMAMAEDVIVDETDVTIIEDDQVVVDDGSIDEPVFVSSCGGCELENFAGGPEVQRGPHAGTSGNGDTAVAAHQGGNACASGALAQMWVCTVQNDSWRN